MLLNYLFLLLFHSHDMGLHSPTGTMPHVCCLPNDSYLHQGLLPERLCLRTHLCALHLRSRLRCHFDCAFLTTMANIPILSTGMVPYNHAHLAEKYSAARAAVFLFMNGTAFRTARCRILPTALLPLRVRYGLTPGTSFVGALPFTPSA